MTLLRLLAGALFMLLGACGMLAQYPSMLDRTPGAEDPADRGAQPTKSRRLAGGAYMSAGLVLVGATLFLPD